MQMDKKEKIFVLDTSVILYDHSALKSFEEHDVAIPVQVLEELDNFKKGNETRNFEARSFIRLIDDISKEHLLTDWLPLNGSNKGNFKVIADVKRTENDALDIFGDDKFDNKILNAALALKNEYVDKKVILVSKDICLRLKAKSLEVNSEDYETGKIKDVQHLYTGKTVYDEFPEEKIEELFEKGDLPIEDLELEKPKGNHFFILKNKKKSILAKYDPREQLVHRVEKQRIFNITPRNAEQSLAISALLDPNIMLVTLQGMAGTGKTLLALAAALEQRRNYRQIYVTRPIIPLSNKDIGYLPGDVASKLDPYMQPLWDNLKLIKGQFDKHDPTVHRIDDMLENEKIAIAPLAYIRGRSLSKIFFIVDEAQNLTPHEIKTVISRAGDDTKIVFTGDIHQIDTPYLDSQSNGLSYLIDKAKNDPLFAHITLEKGERSELANLANELL